MPGKDSKYIEFTKWTNRGRGTMGEFKFKDTVENLKTNLLDNLDHYELENSKYLVPQKLSAYVEKDNLNKN